MPDPVKGPVSDEKAVVPVSKQEVEKAFQGSILQEIFVAKEERPVIPVSVRLPHSLDRLINELLVHPAFPWSDKSDFMRNAAYILAKGITLLYQAQGLDVGKMMPFLSKLEALQLEVERHLALQRTLKIMGDVNESLELFIQEEAWDDLLALLEEYARVINQIPDGFYAQLAILKFFTQSNVAEALRIFGTAETELPPNPRMARRKFRGLRSAEKRRLRWLT